jgi:hypothetical protein
MLITAPALTILNSTGNMLNKSHFCDPLKILNKNPHLEHINHQPDQPIPKIYNENIKYNLAQGIIIFTSCQKPMKLQMVPKQTCMNFPNHDSLYKHPTPILGEINL